MSKLNKYNGTSILTQNSKLKKTSKLEGKRVFNFGIPAYKTQSGKLTCPFAKDCIVFCYAQAGTYTWSNVKPAFEKRYNLTKSNDFVNRMSDAVKSRKATHIRIHDSGDFYSPKYLRDWMSIANLNSNVTFYFYTKSVGVLKSLMKSKGLPSNVKPIFSYGGKQDKMIDKSKDRHAVIFDNLEQLESAGYVNCSDNDLLAISTNKVGLIIH